MKTRVYVNLMSSINNEELPNLPPNFSVAQKLSIDELIDLVTYGIPKSWLKKMDEHDFDPLAGTLNDLVNFCEQMESSEDHGKESTVVQKSSSKSTSNGRIPKKSKTSRSGDGKWCDYHESNTHNTADCTTLQKLKAGQLKISSSASKPQNKVWKRKADDAKSLSKKEINALAKKASSEAFRKKKAELNAVSKRKADSDASVDDDDNSVALMEKMDTIDKELANFDFNLSKALPIWHYREKQGNLALPQ